MAIDLSSAEFERLLRALRAEVPPAAAGNVRSVDSDTSRRCLFSESCTDCYRCTYCTNCSGCTRAVHCDSCVSVHDSAYCVSSQDCVDSQYLTLCFGCVDCTFCIGCVGLQAKEFHILNQPYDRKTWFKIVKELAPRLGVKPAHLR